MSLTLRSPRLTSSTDPVAPRSNGRHEPLWKNFSWTLLGSTYFSVCRWLLIVVVAKLANVEAVGEFMLAMAITTPIFLLSQLQLSAIQTVDTANEYRFGDFVRLRVLTSSLAFAVTLLVVFALQLSPSLVTICLLLAGAKFCEGLSDIAYGLFHKHEHFKQTSISLLLRGTLSVGFMALLMLATQSLTAGMFGLFAAWLFVLAVHDIPATARHLRDRGIDLSRPWHVITSHIASSHRWKGIRNLVVPGATMGIVSVLLSFSAYAPVYFIKLHHTETELGYFAALVTFHAALGMLVVSLGRAVSPRMAMLYSTGRRKDFIRLLARVWMITASISIAGVAITYLFGQLALETMFSVEYGRYAPTLVLVMIAAMLSAMYSPLGFAMTAAKSFRIQVPLLTVTILVTAIACAWAVPHYGILGASIGILARDITLLLLSLAVVGHLVFQMKETYHGDEIPVPSTTRSDRAA